jgi:APA family basic amino acid/polyamine antiporter
MDSARRFPDVAPARLGLWDATSVIVGIMIGVGIFELPASIFETVPGPWHALGVWALGGVLALAGAFCFAELASAYPRSGGEYVYLTRGFGPLVGFLFAWAQLTVIRPASIGAFAYVFATYAHSLWDIGNHGILILALASVVALTAINILGVTLSATAQNVLTVTKIAGLVGIIVVGILYGSRDNLVTQRQGGKEGWFALTMIWVLWAYAGWHEAAYIAAEVKNGRRNIPLALVLGTVAVTVIYLLVNIAFLLAVGLEVGPKQILAEDVVKHAWPTSGGHAISLLIMISSLGAINGMVLTTARIYSEFGADHRLFRPLSHWSRSWETPVRALVVQGVISVALIVGVALFADVREEARSGLDALIAVSAAVFWAFFFLTGIALFVLRSKDGDTPRPFRVPLYPVLPLVFCGWCAYMIYGAIQYKPLESLIGLLILVSGLPFYFIPKKIRPAAMPAPLPEPVASGSR